MLCQDVHHASAPGPSPGPERMRRLGDGTLDPRQLRRILFFGILQAVSIIIGDIAVYQARGRHVQSYSSQIRAGGRPLLSIGRTAHGIIAYGGLATGAFAIGDVLAGLIAFGGLSVGVLAFGAWSAGALLGPESQLAGVLWQD